MPASGVAAELRVGRHHSGQVAGHFHLGHDGDVQAVCIGHHVADVVLCVEIGTVGLASPVAAALQLGVPGVLPHGAHGGQTRVLPDFHAPALVISQVPVEVVHLVERHQAEQLLDFLSGEEVAADVEHETAITETRGIIDADERQGTTLTQARYAGSDMGGQHLAKALECVEDARGCAGVHCDALLGDLQTVALGVSHAVIHPHRHVGPLPGRPLHLQACDAAEFRGKARHLLLLVIVESHRAN